MDLPPEPGEPGATARDDDPRVPAPAAGEAEQFGVDPAPAADTDEGATEAAETGANATDAETAEPVALDPVAAEPVALEPEDEDAEAAEPEALEPEAEDAEAAEPEAPEPEPNVAEVAEPDTAEAEVSKPAAAPAKGADEVISMGELLDEGDYLPEAFERGDTVKGVVVRKAADQLILDVGTKREGIVQASDLAKLPAGMLAGIQVGDEIEVVVVRRPTGDGELLVSINQALSRVDWQHAKEAMDSGEVREMKVSGYNRGGVLVDFGALQGFVPKSHLVSLAKVPADLPPIDRFRQLVGQTIPCKVVEVNQKQRRLIMSERRAVREWRATHKRELLTDLNEGDVRTGTVSSVADFGVFVDLGGADGLVHVSELTHERGRHPKEIVKVGQTVEVYVLSLDREKKRIGLSMKRLQPDPWSKVEDDHYIGQICDARITNLSKFGAFARLPTGLEGLIHLSEISDEMLESPGEVVRPGQEVTVEILSIDPERQRIGLSIRRVPEHLRTEHPSATESDHEAAQTGAGASHVVSGTAQQPAAGHDLISDEPADAAAPEPMSDEPADEAAPEPMSDEPADEAAPEPMSDEPADKVAPEPMSDEPEPVANADGHEAGASEDMASTNDNLDTGAQDGESVEARTPDGSTEPDH